MSSESSFLNKSIFKGKALIVSMLLFSSLEASGSDGIVFTFSATNATDTTITVTGSGTATTNANGTEWSYESADGKNVLDDQSSSATSFNVISSALSGAGSFALTGDLKLSANGEPDIAFSKIFFDHDNVGDDIGFSPDSNTTVATNTTYTLSGSATFTLTSGDFSAFYTGTYVATNFDSIKGGFLNFTASDISVVVNEITQTPTLTYDATTFTEASVNDGSTSTTLTVTLANDTFTTSSGAMTENTHYTVANVPSGLTAVVTGTSATTATITLTGNASAHENANDISDLTITFLADAFTTTTDASTITNYAKSDLSVDFEDAPTVDFNSSIVTANSWNMIAVPDEINITASNINATIWTFNNSSNQWEQPTTLTAGKGYLLYTTSSIGTISAQTVTSTITDDNTTIKNVDKNSWTFVGISKSTSGFSWNDIYNPNNTLKNGCYYTQIFYYDSANSTWNTTSNIPYLSAVWVKQNCPSGD